MDLRRTPLYERHDARGASFTDFGGWEMPVSFDSISTEHAAVRENVGVFDVSHMGEIAVQGPDAAELCQRLTTNDVMALQAGRAQYSAVTDESGILLDDIMLYRMGPDSYLFVPNAGKDDWMTTRWRTHAREWELNVDIENRTDSLGMLAVQGPAAADALAAAGCPTDDIARRDIVEGDVDGITCQIAGTGYTGEAGYELLVPWEDLAAVDAAIEATPCGLGARDTLRLEMGYVLAGNEFHHEDNPRTPLEAGLDFIVDLEAEPGFVGRDALREQREQGPAEVLVGFILEERGIPRAGYDICNPAGEVIGSVTSGTMSPTASIPIGLGYVAASYAASDTEVGVTIRGENKKARIVTPPFLNSRT